MDQPIMCKIAVELDERILKAIMRESRIRKLVGQDLSIGEIVACRLCKEIEDGKETFVLRFKSEDPKYMGSL